MAGLTKKSEKPRLQNLDAMFGLNDSETQTTNKIASIEIKNLVSFNGHPFRLYEGVFVKRKTSHYTN